MIQQNKLVSVENKASELVTLINESTEWVNRYLKDEEKLDSRYELKKCRRRINKIKNVVTKKPAIALFGASQVGKSYMANNLLYDENNKLLVCDSVNKLKYDFIAEINPEGNQNEATGAITRFTSTHFSVDSPGPVQVKVFSPKDIICIIIDTYNYDFEDKKKQPASAEIEQKVSLLSSYVNPSFEQHFLTDDDVLEVEEYLLKYFSKKGAILNLSESGYWKQLSEVIKHIDPENWYSVFNIAWNEYPELDNVFNEAIKVLAELDFQTEVYIGYESLLRKHKKSIIDVATLNQFFDEVSLNEVATGVKKANISSGKLSFITREVSLTISDESIDNRPFIKKVDIIDFPGARSRPEIKDFEKKSLLEMMLRGKVSYLFNLASINFQSNILCVCVRTAQHNVTTMPRLINQWVEDNLGATPEEREKNLSGLTTPPLFIIFTWWNTQLQFIDNDDPDPTDRIKKLFKTKLEEDLGNYKWPSKWVAKAGSFVKFNNYYLLRDFKRSDKIFKQNRNEGVFVNEEYSDSFVDPVKEKFYTDYKQAFLKYHNDNDSFFSNPQLNFEEASVPNKDGSEYIIKNLLPITTNEITVPIYINNLNMAVQQAKDSLSSHYHSDQSDEQIRKAARDASDLQLRMDIVFGTDAYYFGSFIEHMMLKESEILHFYHKLLQSDKLVKKKDTNKYILLRLQNPGLQALVSTEPVSRKSDPSYKSNLEVLRMNYNKGSIEETEHHFEEVEKIDLEELFYGDLYNLQNNSVILAEEARDFWFMQKLNPENFNFFIEKGFDKSLLTRLFDTFKISFEKHNLVKIIAEEIRGFVDVSKKIERAEDMIAHITSGIINEFVNSAGWSYCSALEKERISETNNTNNLNLRILPDNDVFQTIAKVNPEDGSMTLEKLLTYMDNLNENLSMRPVDQQAIQYVPMVKNYQRWVNLMRVAFIANCNIPTYDIEANAKLGVLLDQMNTYRFEIS